jgi:hypothetical protein
VMSDITENRARKDHIAVVVVLEKYTINFRFTKGL